MDFKISCQSCGQHIAVTTEQIGIKANCPTCGCLFVVTPPAPEETKGGTRSKPVTAYLFMLLAVVVVAGFFVARHHRFRQAVEVKDEGRTIPQRTAIADDKQLGDGFRQDASGKLYSPDQITPNEVAKYVRDKAERDARRSPEDQKKKDELERQIQIEENKWGTPEYNDAKLQRLQAEASGL